MMKTLKTALATFVTVVTLAFAAPAAPAFACGGYMPDHPEQANVERAVTGFLAQLGERGEPMVSRLSMQDGRAVVAVAVQTSEHTWRWDRAELTPTEHGWRVASWERGEI